ncbi:MAG: ABC transporter permease, partial [Geminicoccaceae bacterium]|nr:ABC transporter permease [Geminicoccaceae bacterium]
MAEPRRPAQPGTLAIRGLHVHYGRSHALQGVDLELPRGVLGLVGRNGMGKTTLCKAIMGLVPASAGSIRFKGEELVGRTPTEIARLGVGYVPQGRRLWRSLTVEEHLRLVAGSGRSRGPWSIERIYELFPRLAERRHNGGGQLSGGEQQMLAIARALLRNPELLVMDEPTEGLAPVIVEQVERLLHRLGEEGEMAILVVEQNIAVATSVAERVAIMVNGRVFRVMDSARLAADRDLQQRLLGVGRHAHEDLEAAPAEPAAGEAETARPARPRGPRKVWNSNPVLPNRWSQPASLARIEATARILATGEEPVAAERPREPAPLRPLAAPGEAVVLVVGTLDTKGAELRFVRDQIRAAGLRSRLVDLSTSGKPSSADVTPQQVALHHPQGPNAVFTGDRGRSVAAMAEAFVQWIRRQEGIAGIIAAGGSGGTAMATPAMRALPLGVPKVMVSTMVAGDVRRFVEASDIVLVPAVTDVQGLNRVSREILGNAAHALVGMVKHRLESRRAIARGPARADLPAIGLTMFGVTTPAVQRIAQALEGEVDCLVFHATGIGGMAMEKLVEDGQLVGAIDLTTTEIADLLLGGVLACTEDRLGAFVRTRVPYIGAPGALDVINFGPPETVPAAFRGRLLYRHNPQVTLVRTTAEECTRIGRWIAERLNRMDGPVTFLLPEGGLSALDAPGQPFF